MRKPYLLLLIFMCFAAVKPAFAGWPIGKYRSVLIPSFNYYKSDNTWDRSGRKVVAAPGAGFTSYSAGIYYGYGLSRRMDLILNVIAPSQNSAFVDASGNVIKASNQGVGDMQVGINYNLANFNYKSFLTVGVSGIVPLYDTTNAAVALGYGSYGSEVKLMYAGGIDNGFLKHTYYNLEGGYRRYFSAQGPNVFLYSASLGIPLDKRNQIGFEVGGQVSQSANKAFNANLAINRDFGFVKGSANYGHSFTRRFSVFFVGFYTLAGYNTGIGYGGSVQTIFRL
ncbi:hypothetical protein [Mucilaginibacter myungsuensis]|uniref:Type IX secretion system PorP/SprF family membrane protein n=1 Tax=Mucilaginibacter myungsuensis TaxID=649104 RepID=A0A929PVC1_9SPHI|nr:hypothetical protein [Mucilaginibacter myungsuensis]MBE9660979.1 hypothetical protein [Mucilaginibacter myungsuensis]MDN3601025.1 hypothetical protein [Mucilaginibacter myungsuensis]